MNKIIVNKIKCKKCGDIIESTYRHEFISCSCGAVSVDGGHDYLRRLGYEEDYEELSEIEMDKKAIDKAKMHLINKIFDNETIRTVWNDEEEKYYISVVDVIGVLTGSRNPRHYWNVLKGRLKQEGNKTVTSCDQLKLKASDGKFYKTDVVDIEGMFRLIESIPSKNAEPIKQWLARLGKERIDEVFDPSIAMERSIELYRFKGYDDTWIDKRIKGIQSRKKLTDVWKAGGITQLKDYAILTNEIYKGWSGMTSKEYKKFKGLKKESLRDNMSDIEIALADLGELTTRDIAINESPKGLKDNISVAKRGGSVAKSARDAYEKETNNKVITNKK